MVEYVFSSELVHCGRSDVASYYLYRMCSDVNGLNCYYNRLFDSVDCFFMVTYYNFGGCYVCDYYFIGDMIYRQVGIDGPQYEYAVCELPDSVHEFLRSMVNGL